MAITISTVSPNNLPINGNTTIRVTGTGLNTVTTVTYNGVSIGGFTKISPSVLEFPSPEFDDSGAKTFNLVLGDGSTTATKSVTAKVFDYAKTPESNVYVKAYNTGHVDTTATSRKPEWVQQAEVMELREPDGDKVVAPLGVDAPEYDTKLTPIFE